jgi:peroxiredoxin
MKNLIMVLLMFLFIFVSCVSEDVSDDEEKEDKNGNQTINDDGEENLLDEENVELQNDDDKEDEAVVDQEEIAETPDQDESIDFCTDYATAFPLVPGDCVPDFTLPAQDGVTMVTLSDYRGKYVLFSSFPMANTPVCTGQMQKLDEMFDDFTAENIQPFGLNNESPDKKEGWCETMGIEKLLILADHDPKDAVSVMFGIAGGMTARANTVIGPDGRFIMKKACANSSCIPAILEDIKGIK